jgi:hypothetical protein
MALDEYLINEMVDTLVASGVVADADRAGAGNALAGCWKDRVAHIWTTGDVQDRFALSDDQAREVLEEMVHSVDCDIGLNWGFLDFCAEELFPGTGREDVV